MLETRNVSVFYGRHRALENVSVSVSKGEIVVMLGANGAGKSTFLRAVAGQTRKMDGSTVLMDGADITRRPSHEIVETGIALVPEDRGIFADLTVQENLILGAHPVRARALEAQNIERVLSLFPKLKQRSKQLVRTMSGGERQMVAMGRAMMSAPTILLLDEPSLGLAPLLCTELFPHACPDQRDRRRYFFGRAECQAESGHRRPRLFARQRPHRRRRHRRGPVERRKGQGRLSGRVTNLGREAEKIRETHISSVRPP